MINKGILTLISIAWLIFYCNFNSALAQKVLYLKPHLSGQVPFNKYDKAYGKTSAFKTYNFNIELGVGADLQLEVNRRWRVSAGINYGSYGFSYKIKDRGRSSGASLLRFPLLVHYTIKDNIYFLALDKIHRRHLFVFRLYSLSGVSFNHQLSSNDEPYLSKGRDQIEEGLKENISWTNYSIYIGLGMQFYTNDKDRLDISIMYTKGLGSLASKTISYTSDGVRSSAKLITEGSMLSFNVAYPIKLIPPFWKKKKDI